MIISKFQQLLSAETLGQDDRINIEYFDENSVTVIVAYSVIEGGVALGFVVWRDDGGPFLKRGLRETAIARLQKKPIVLRCAPRMTLRAHKENETTTEYTKSIAQYLSNRDNLFNEAFSILPGLFNAWPSPLYTRDDEKFLEKVNKANANFLKHYPMLTDSDVNDLRAQKAVIIANRRKFLREAVMLGYAQNKNK